MTEPKKGFNESKIFSKIIHGAKEISSKVFSIEYPKDIDEKTIAWATESLVKDMGPLVVAWPSVSLKVLHGAMVNKKTQIADVPPYLYSCPQVDKMLFGHEPDGAHVISARYYDVSRLGPEVASWRSLSYLNLTIKQMRKSKDPKIQNWISRYGVGGVLPFATLRNIVQQFIDYGANIFSVPVTSMAEAYKAILYRLAIVDPHSNSDIDPWLRTDQKSARSTQSNKLFDVFWGWIQSKTLGDHSIIIGKKMINSTEDLFFCTPEDIAQLVMKMVHDEKFTFKKKGQHDFQTLSSVLHNFGSDYFDPGSKASHYLYGGQDDASEIVVQWKNRKDEQFPATPWSLFILIGDGQTSMEQMIRQAELFQKLYNKAPVYILKGKDGQPINSEDETQIPIIRFLTSLLIKERYTFNVRAEIEKYYAFSMKDDEKRRRAHI